MTIIKMIWMMMKKTRMDLSFLQDFTQFNLELYGQECLCLFLEQVIKDL